MYCEDLLTYTMMEWIAENSNILSKKQQKKNNKKIHNGNKRWLFKAVHLLKLPSKNHFDAESTGYVHTTFCRLSRLKKTKAALKNNGLNVFFFFHIYTSETYIFYRDHCTKKSQMESFKSVGRVRLQLSEKGSYVMTRRAGLLCNSCCVHVRVCAYVCVHVLSADVHLFKDFFICECCKCVISSSSPLRSWLLSPVSL